MKKEYRSTLRTKRMIRRAFAELLREKKSLESITVRELTERADLAKSTFYNHYADIYAVAEEFEGELIQSLSQVLDEIKVDHATEYSVYIHRVIEFLKINETLYRGVIGSSDVRFFIEKLKLIISKKIFEENTALPFSQDKAERYVQIRFLTNAFVDTMVDYFTGTLELSLDQVGEIMLSFLNRLQEPK